MKKILALVSLLALFSVNCDNLVGPSSLSINPEVTHLNVGQSQVFNISGLNGSDFRVFARFYLGPSVCYFDCNPDAYGYIERVGANSIRYTLRKEQNPKPLPERVIELEVYANDDVHRVSALVYIN